MTSLGFLSLANTLIVFLCVCLPLQAGTLSSDQVPVRYPEGTTHGFLVLRDLSGTVLASGDLIQLVGREKLVSRLTFRFKDGSIDDETTVFSQHGTFRLISDHHIQKGPAFPRPIDASINVPKNCVTSRSEGGGKSETSTEHMQLPPDLANGMVLYFLKNMPPHAKQLTAHYLAFSPKPRVVKLAVSEEEKETFDIANTPHTARHFVIKIDLGGITGMIAPLIGQAPSDLNLWVLDGDAPAFIRMEGQLFNGGPIWAVELSSPVWPKARRAAP